jgi:alanyl-tRNA synthetase
MLGNFSFGDYFKKDAIHWAWEFLTNELKLSKEKLWVSVYKEDAEAFAIWANEIKIPMERIIKLGDKSNFWPSNARLNGPNGPCGPCSEIFYDYGVNDCPKGQACNPECSCGRFSEVWNLVFTQFNRKDGGVLEPLPAKNIDTGMGLERLAAVVQGVRSNYETDNFIRIIQKIEEIAGEKSSKLTREEKRIIADHMRAIVFAIADGVIPSNKERGSVVKKLITTVADITLRKTGMIFGRDLAPVVVELMQSAYPDLLKDKGDLPVAEYIYLAEQDYKDIFVTQIPKLKQKINSVYNGGGSRTENNRLIGYLVYRWKDTHGLTLDTIKLVLDEMNIPVEDLQEIINVYAQYMEGQRERSRAASKIVGDVFVEQDFALNLPKTEFLGYKETKAEATVLKVAHKEDRVFQIILNRTPFYAESGGQVGDTGNLIGPTGKMRVEDTRKINDIFVHYGLIEGEIKEGDKVQAMIDEPRRRAIMRNHTATHLLQAALREVLGTHIKQQGSLVEEGRLRFDFTHPKAIRPEELKKIENRIDEFIRRADPVTTEVLTLEEAKKKGALAFFAEKYGQTVRVISIGDYSREFCGGTHVSSTAEIEAMKIVSEGSVAQGIRRVEALTGKSDVERFLRKKQQELAIIERGERKKQQEKENQNVYFQKLKSSVDEMVKAGENIKGSNLIIRSLEDIDITLLRKLSDLLKQKVKSGIFILGAKGPQDASVILSVTDDLVARGIKANELMNQIAPLMDGSGGGRPSLAQAGSKNPQKLDGALAQAREIVKAKL